MGRRDEVAKRIRPSLVKANEARDVAEITPQRYLVLSLLIRHHDLSGRDLRAMLSDNGVDSSGPQFYQMMSRLEDSGYVLGRYAQKAIEHQVVNERRYRITQEGTAAWEKTRDFYSSHSLGVQTKLIGAKTGGSPQGKSEQKLSTAIPAVGGSLVMTHRDFGGETPSNNKARTRLMRVVAIGECEVSPLPIMARSGDINMNPALS